MEFANTVVDLYESARFLMVFPLFVAPLALWAMIALILASPSR